MTNLKGNNGSSRKKLFRVVYGPEGDGQTPPPPPAAKTFTQADVDKIISERLASEKARAEKEKAALMTKVEELGLTTKQKAELEARVEELAKASMTKEEQAKAENDKLRKEHERAVSEAKAQADKFESIYKEEKLLRELHDAAAEHKAYRPSQVVALLRHGARVVDELDPTGKPTGRFVSKVTLETAKDGKTVVLELSPSGAVKAMREDPDRFGNLFESGVKSGLGGNNVGGANGSSDLQNMPMEEFVKKYRESPASIGLTKR